MFRILVVEDDPNVRKLMEKVLRDGGYEPICAKDGVEALEMMDHYLVDLAVVDLMMPRMDGYEFTLLLRQTGQELPILMVTAKDARSQEIMFQYEQYYDAENGHDLQLTIHQHKEVSGMTCSAIGRLVSHIPHVILFHELQNIAVSATALSQHHRLTAHQSPDFKDGRVLLCI